MATSQVVQASPAMRWPRLYGPRRLPLTALAVFASWTLFLWIFLPYNNSILLSVRFLSYNTLSYVQRPFSSDDWLFGNPTFPVQLDKDVAFIIKTGYGTRDRVPPQLDALGWASGQTLPDNVLVIADFATELEHNGMGFEVHDAVAPLAQSEALADYQLAGKLVKYRNMTDAILAGDAKKAGEISKAVGWELDAMKFIPGLDLAFRKMPTKKWYVMLDDDTFVFKPSLELLLGHLDSSISRYLGNAVGDFKGRFAHGGSSVILSRAAVIRLFEENPRLVPESYIDSLNEKWGDKLVATTFMKMGVYLDERYSHYFNGEPPRRTRIHSDRFCSPIVSFHGLAGPNEMKDVGETFGGIDHPVLWSQLWEMYGEPKLDVFQKNPIRQSHDHVGRTDEWSKTVHGIDSVEKCLEVCEKKDAKSCLAWTWEKETKMCNTGSWFIVGEKSADRFSGLNVQRVQSLAQKCRKPGWGGKHH